MRTQDCLILLEVFFSFGLAVDWPPNGLVENFADILAKSAVNIFLPARTHYDGMLPVVRRFR